MATVQDLLDRKGADIVSIGSSATVVEAARLMNARGVGGLVVVDAPGQLLGIFTERDILRRVVAPGLDAAKVRIAEVLTTKVITCLPGTSVEECGAIMSSRRIRHLPVADDSGLKGLVTSGDVLAYRVAESEATIEYMNAYMFDIR
ncbi:MAG: CBS domain-containing protein [Gemmatimonadetes bacterium]|nr:CBS domain-containing protein [Gemmatimonadota bacterium]MCC6771060.1 CBS domain-containing protein [Gemmatimonadaceae bacterium]